MVTEKQTAKLSDPSEEPANLTRGELAVIYQCLLALVGGMMELCNKRPQKGELRESLSNLGVAIADRSAALE